MASLPNPNTVTYEEWLLMPEVSDATEEVVDGEIIVVPPAKLMHARIVGKLARVIGASLEPQKFDVISSSFGLIMWIVSPEARTVEILELNHSRLERSRLCAEGILTPKLFPDVHIDIATIWPD